MANRSRRTKPVMAKAGVTRNPSRRYSCGGKLYSRVVNLNLSANDNN